MRLCLAKPRQKRWRQGFEIICKSLHIDFIAPRIECRDGDFIRRSTCRFCNGFKRRHPDERERAGKRKTARRGKADTKPGESAGTNRASQRIEIGKADACFFPHAVHKRHQCFRMAARTLFEMRYMEIAAAAHS